MSDDESRHAARTLYADLIDNHAIRHALLLIDLTQPPQCRGDYGVLLCFSDLRGNTMSSSTLSTALHQYKQDEPLLNRLRGWEEWEWNDCEEQRNVETVIAMPCLEILIIRNYKLSCLGAGLASSKRHAKDCARSAILESAISTD
jgi:hypothetical protein